MKRFWNGLARALAKAAVWVAAHPEVVDFAVAQAKKRRQT